MNLKPCVMGIVLAVVAATVWAQQPGGPGPGPQQPVGPGLGGVMADEFFPPELVMRYQQAIELKEDQKAAIKAEMQKTMARFTDLQWQQSAEVETMASLVKQQTVDEKKTLAQFDQLLSIENEIKRMHLAMLIKVKNGLTPEQQAKLRELQRLDRGPSPNFPGPPGAGDRRGPERRPAGPGGDRQGPPPRPPMQAPPPAPDNE